MTKGNQGEKELYIPRHFKITEMSEIREFIHAHSFGAIVSTENGKPIASHLPLELRKLDGDDYITGHMAYANPQWKTFEVNPENVLVIYQGPHAYISSSWYGHENVPTWNYQSVHIYGTASIMSEQELEEDLIHLLKKYEQHRENPSLWETYSPQNKKQIRGIVGFKIHIQDVQAAYKLSQNRNEEDYQNIIDKLYDEEDFNAHKMAEVMKRRK